MGVSIESSARKARTFDTDAVRSDAIFPEADQR
jgi:hypothetical protein